MPVSRYAALTASGARGHAYLGPNIGYSKELENRLLVDMLRSLSISHQQRFFDRRVERVLWSPRSKSVLAVGR
jgi:hypothetical protein